MVLPLIVCLVALALAPSASAHATRHRPHAGHGRCAPLAATGVGQDLGEGRTTAIITVAGVAVGTSAAAFTITGVAGNVASFSGPIVFTGLGGTLTAQVTGTLDLAGGAFVSTSTSVTGTGSLARVTGSLTFTGSEDLTTGAFTESITGQLCRTRGQPPSNGQSPGTASGTLRDGDGR